jgi:hypothetical protein
MDAEMVAIATQPTSPSVGRTSATTEEAPQHSSRKDLREPSPEQQAFFAKATYRGLFSDWFQRRRRGFL